MKSIIKAVATVMVMLLLFACNNNKEIKVAENFNAKINIQTKDITIKGVFSRQINGTMEYTISEPINLSGMKYVCSENMYTIYYHDMERSGDIWQNSPVKILFNVINHGVGIPLATNEVMTEYGKCTYHINKERFTKIEVSNMVATFEYE